VFSAGFTEPVDVFRDRLFCAPPVGMSQRDNPDAGQIFSHCDRDVATVNTAACNQIKCISVRSSNRDGVISFCMESEHFSMLQPTAQV